MKTFYTVNLENELTISLRNRKDLSYDDMLKYLKTFISDYDLCDFELISKVSYKLQENDFMFVALNIKNKIIELMDKKILNSTEVKFIQKNIEINNGIISEIIQEIGNKYNGGTLRLNDIIECRKRISWITYKNQEIYRVDYQDLGKCKLQKLMVIFNLAKKIIEAKYQKKNNVLFINLMRNDDFTNASQFVAERFTKDHMNYWVQTDTNTMDGFSIGSAGVGFKGMKKLLIQYVINDNMVQFDIEKEALEYLILPVSEKITYLNSRGLLKNKKPVKREI
jgi:hypothetical protein